MRIFSIVAVLSSSLISVAAKADLHFQGQFIIISATGNCDKFIANGLTLNADYHPAVLEGAPPQQFKISAMNIYYNILGLY